MGEYYGERRARRVRGAASDGGGAAFGARVSWFILARLVGVLASARRRFAPSSFHLPGHVEKLPWSPRRHTAS